LVLANEKVFKGKTFGATGTVIAETVFTTGMTGYLETLTDKSYYGQIVTQTFPLIGNYGVIPSDFESERIALSGYIVKEWCREPSNFRSQGDLDTFFKKCGVIGLTGIDTRSLVKSIRENGVMNGCITNDLSAVDLDAIRAYSVKDAVKNVSCKEETVWKAADFGAEKKYHVVLMDFGLKENIRRELCKRGCDVTVVPYDTTAQRIKELCPDGIMLSNGPGDPAENVAVIANLKEIMTLGIPIFGICLGHQLLALANGFSTVKLKYGHRGANQPAKNLFENRVFITSQNHGYAVQSESIDPQKADLLFVNANDNTCEGIRYREIPAFSVQFHPEACGGPQDTAFLFDRFLAMMKV
jgi:carbamoyl-phosphate synthase small subunit